MIGFPLLLIPLAICNIIIFLMPGVGFDAPVATLTLLSGRPWTLTLGDAVLVLGALLLLLEVVKSARPHGKYATDHLLALLVSGGAAAEFLLLPQFASSTFFLLTVLALVDFLAGLALRSRSRSRKVVAAKQVAEKPVEQPAAVVAPAPAAVPAAASVAEAILLDRPEPVPGPPPVSTDASPQIASPDLQPANTNHPSLDKPAR
jgi:hypothetical protein